MGIIFYRIRFLAQYLGQFFPKKKFDYNFAVDLNFVGSPEIQILIRDKMTQLNLWGENPDSEISRK